MGVRHSLQCNMSASFRGGSVRHFKLDSKSTEHIQEVADARARVSSSAVAKQTLEDQPNKL